MYKQSPSLRRPLAVLFILLILMNASVAFLPHSHDYPNAACSVCILAESSRELLLGALLTAAVCLSAHLVCVMLLRYIRRLSIREHTPVALKVKLSN